MARQRSSPLSLAMGVDGLETRACQLSGKHEKIQLMFHHYHNDDDTGLFYTTTNSVYKHNCVS